MLTDSFPCIKTQRCELVEFSDSDCEDLYLLLQDRQIQRYLPGLLPFCKNQDTALLMIGIFRMNFLEGKAILWKINLNGHMVGFIGMADIPDMPYVFYAISPTSRCQGYMKECLKALKAQLMLHRYPMPAIEADPTNEPSLKIVSLR